MRNSKGQFVKGHIPWHKDKKGIKPPNSGSFKLGCSAWNEGKTHSSEAKRKMSEAAKLRKKRYGQENPAWRGNDVKYAAMHRRIYALKGSPWRCEICYRVKGEVKRLEWANIDHSYEYCADDYLSLCTGCHRNYDKSFNNY